MHADNVTLFHAPVLLALIALQFQKPTRTLTGIAIAAVPLSLYIGGFVATRAAIAAAVIAAAGLASHFEFDAITQWFRWLATASWCLCILAVFATIGAFLTLRYFS